MEASLYHQIRSRLEADENVDTRVVQLVKAACAGAEALGRALASPGQSGASYRPEPPEPEPRRRASFFLGSISVSGIRGIGRTAQLRLTPGPGLTLVLGRNGSGKSSFAEACEMVLTGESANWEGLRSTVWKDGWRNLHAKTAPRAEVELLVEGQARLVVRRQWGDSSKPESGTQSIVPSDEKAPAEAEIPDADKLTESATEAGGFRPFLSYPELGALHAQPSKAFDKLQRVLGLGDVSEAVECLNTERARYEELPKAEKKQRKGLIDEGSRLLATCVDDPRPAECLQLLKKRTPDRVGIAGMVRAALDGAAPDGNLRTGKLARVGNTVWPEPSEWSRIADALRSAWAGVAQATTALVSDHRQLARVLEAALPVIENAPERCPVCAAALQPDQIQEMTARLATAQQRGKQLAEEERRLGEARDAARGVVHQFPSEILPLVEELGFGSGLEAKRTQLLEQLRSGTTPEADGFERLGLEFSEALESARAQALATRVQLDAGFRGLAVKLEDWLKLSEEVANDGPTREALTEAHKWLQGTAEDLRSERFEPIAEQVKNTWAELGQGSFVSVDSVQLVSRAQRRSLKVGVSVGDADSAALGVMSQGELNALAFSLFLPRMMLPESPFRFLVIDDPVQALDPAKVDGLARVLAGAARTHQVIVFTHDPRLRDAVRRLQIEAQILEVTRGSHSAVSIRPLLSPMQQYLQDARHILEHEGGLGQDLAARVVPGFCRSSLEAACFELVRKRQLGRGDEHGEVERRLRKAGGLHHLLALALFDDASEAAQLEAELATKGLAEALPTIAALKAGAHLGHEGDLRELVQQTNRLVKHLGKRR